jgi:hypothetical protein
MTSWLRTAALLTLTLAPLARAQDSGPPPSNLIDVNPLSLLFGEVSVEYERSLGSAVSIVIGPHAILFKSVIDTSAYGGSVGFTPTGAGLSLGLHIFPGAQALHGFWIGPEVDADWASATISGISVSGASYSVFGILGYTFLPTSNIAISLGLGGGRRLNSVTATDANGDTVVEFGTGWVFTGRAAIGYAF